MYICIYVVPCMAITLFMFVIYLKATARQTNGRTDIEAYNSKWVVVVPALYYLYLNI